MQGTGTVTWVVSGWASILAALALVCVGDRVGAEEPEGLPPAPIRFAHEKLVEIHVRDHSQTGRKSWPVTGGIPLPKGKVRDVKKIGLLEMPSQTRVLSRWSDGSVKWVLLDYQTDLPAGGRSEQTVVLADEEIPAPSGITIKETDEWIVVDTGVLGLVISKRQFELFREVRLDLNGNGRYETEERVVKPDSGQDQFFDLQENRPQRPTIPYAARDLLRGTSRTVNAAEPTVPGGSRWIRPEGGGSEERVVANLGEYSAKVVQRGPLRTVIQMNGRFGRTPDANEYTVWVHAYRGKPFLRVQHTFVFRGDPQKDNIRRLGLGLPLNFDSPPRFTAAGLADPVQLEDRQPAYLFNTGPHDVFHLEHLAFPLDWEVRAGAIRRLGNEQTAGWIDVTGSDFGVTVSIRDMAFLYPKELSYDPRTKALNAWLWPDHGNLVLDLRASGWPDGMQGISFTHDVFYHFHTADEADRARAVAAGLNDPPQPYADPHWYGYRGTQAAGMIMPRDDRQFPKTEAYLAAGTAMVERSMTEFGWLGMLNYGDLLSAYSKNERGRLGTWGLADPPDDYGGWRHGNTMLSYRMFVQYLRTGERRYWLAAEAHLKHVRDVLIKHYNREKPQWTGLGRRHSAYWGAGPGHDRPGGVAMDGYGTNWLGHYMHWNLTGDWRTYDVLGEIRGAWNRLGNTVIEEISGGAYVGLKLTGGIPGYEQAAAEAENFLDTAVERTRRGDRWRDCTWFFGYSLYLADAPDERIRQAILDWWEAGNHGPDKYDMYWDRDAAAAVYWAADGDTAVRKAVYDELLKYGCTDNSTARRLDARLALYRRVGLAGLFTCDIHDLAKAVAPGYWRVKDDLYQLQWDEPLSMAVLDHYRRALKSSGKTGGKARP